MKTEGIVLDSIDYMESSKIVHLYTECGHISIKVKGALNPKKGLLGFITTGNAVRFVVTDANLPSLMEYDTVSTVYKITENLKAASVFMVMLEVIKEIPEDANHKKIYPYVAAALNDLLSKDPVKLLCIFLVKMLYAFGVAPNLKTCVSCGSKDLVFFDSSLGGALCKSCHPLEDKDKLTLWQEYYYEKKDVSLYRDTDYQALLKNIREYYQRYTGISLKLGGLIKE